MKLYSPEEVQALFPDNRRPSLKRLIAKAKEAGCCCKLGRGIGFTPDQGTHRIENSNGNGSFHEHISHIRPGLFQFRPVRSVSSLQKPCSNDIHHREESMNDITIPTAALALQAKEITRLRAINAELVEALKVFAHHFGPLDDNEMLHPEARRCFTLARAAIAKAEKEGA